ncbi:uncharacterized protein LOC131988359 [Centropristis striata]|uniref:uncharacterized protein LOC131988359 n=1 Tax=Centropristis striata TaxID=184440 RepID=UPI0027E188E9|nr:uncharacterized protein LOC131988359 [Centropristis striata]
MICSILLLLSLTSCVSGRLVVNVSQTSYQAEENQNITLEWTFTTRRDTSLKRFSIFCQLLAELRPLFLFHLHEGVEVPETQDQQFAGRVQFDKDVLREGRLRLHVSRLRTNDSGLYLCDVIINHSGNFRSCRLNVTAARDRPEPETPNTPSQGIDPPAGSGPQPESPAVIFLYCNEGETSQRSYRSLGCFLEGQNRIIEEVLKEAHDMSPVFQMSVNTRDN